jgi:hypothetical protein
MKYLCSIFFDEKKLDAMPEREIKTPTEEAPECDNVLRKKGRHFGVAHALQPSHAASTPRVRKGKASVTDGPFADTMPKLCA